MEDIKIARIVCPVDYSEYSDYGLDYALHLAQTFKADLLLLHVVEIPLMPSYPITGMPGLGMPVEELERGANERMDEMVAHCKEGHQATEGTVRTGTPFLEIINFARENEADMIVMGTHGRTGLQHMLIGSVAEKVVRKSPCPVLTVKHPHHDFEMP